MLENLIPLINQLDQLNVSHIQLKCLLDATNPKQIALELGGEKQFSKLVRHLKSKFPHMGLILQAPYPHIQSKIPFCYAPKHAFFFQAASYAIPIDLRYYVDILAYLRDSLECSKLMAHEINQFKTLQEAFELAFIKTKEPTLALFSHLNLWFSACPARKQIIKNYLINLPAEHYNAFFPKTRLDEWHLKEPELITLTSV